MTAVAAWLFDWWELWAIVAAGLVGTGIAPHVVARTERTRSLDGRVRRAVARAGVPPECVRVVDANGAPVAFAAGYTPGRGRVFVSDPLVTALPPAEVAAVVRHEYGHLARLHVPLRLGVPTAFALAWAAGATVAPGPGFLVGVALVPPAAYCTLRVARWCEFDADGYARVGGLGGPLASALRRLAATGHVADGGRLSRHPPLSRRVARLGGRKSRPSRCGPDDLR